MKCSHLLLVLLAFAMNAFGADGPADLKLLADVSAAYAKLEPQSIRPAEGFIKYDYLIPGGYYKQMWDWDGFFIGVHLAHQSREKAKYLKYWVLDFAWAHLVNGKRRRKRPILVKGVCCTSLTGLRSNTRMVGGLGMP